MDAIDEELLGLLRENARRSFSALGREIGLSTNAVAARVRRLEGAGVILGYTIVTDDRGGMDESAPQARGGLEVFIDVRLDAETDGERFLAGIEPIRTIVDAVHVTGPYDYLLHARVDDTGALDALLRRLKASCGVAQSQTRVALRSGR